MAQAEQQANPRAAGIAAGSSILTVPHSGTSSLLHWLIDDGHRIARYESNPLPGTTRWAHWWEDWPADFLDSPAVSTLRDPGLSLLSSYIRGEEGAIPEHVMSWTRLATHAHAVTTWLPMQALPWDTNGVTDPDGLRERYLAGLGLPRELSIAMAYIRPLALRVFNKAGVAWPGPC